jgi:hypothetical protein
MRTTAKPIRQTTGCSANTARGTWLRRSAITTAPATTPATRQAKVRRLISEKPEKRHMLCGTLKAMLAST